MGYVQRCNSLAWRSSLLAQCQTLQVNSATVLPVTEQGRSQGILQGGGEKGKYSFSNKNRITCN